LIWIDPIPIELQLSLVPEVETAPGHLRTRIRRAFAHLEVRHERDPTVRGVGCPDLSVVVGDPVGVTGPAVPAVMTGVVPGDSDIARGLIDGDGRIPLAVGPGVVVQPDGRCPGRSIV